MNVKELRDLCKANGVKGYSRLSKDGLVTALHNAGVNFHDNLPLLEVDSEPINPADLVPAEPSLFSILTPTVESFGAILGNHSKSEARKLRKEMRAGGHSHLAGAKRIVNAQPAKIAA